MNATKLYNQNVYLNPNENLVNIGNGTKKNEYLRNNYISFLAEGWNDTENC